MGTKKEIKVNLPIVLVISALIVVIICMGAYIKSALKHRKEDASTITELRAENDDLKEQIKTLEAQKDEIRSILNNGLQTTNETEEVNANDVFTSNTEENEGTEDNS